MLLWDQINVLAQTFLDIGENLILASRRVDSNELVRNEVILEHLLGILVVEDCDPLPDGLGVVVTPAFDFCPGEQSFSHGGILTLQEEYAQGDTDGLLEQVSPV